MSTRAGSENGYVLVVVAGMLVIMLGFAALAVDVGVMYAAHTSAQRAADAAALAGAYTFITNPANATDAAIRAQARTTATDTAIQNTILGATIQSSELTPPYGQIDVNVDDRQVTVNLSHTIPTFFAGVLGKKFVTVSVVAVAEASRDINCADCVKPWFIPNNVLANNGCNACTDGQLLIAAGATAPTPWALTQLNRPFALHAAGASTAMGPGNYYSIILDNDIDEDPPPGYQGASIYKDNISTCSNRASIDCGRRFNVKTGRMVGPTKMGTALFISFGIEDRFNKIDPWRDTWGPLNGNNPTYIGPSSPSPPAIGGSKTSSHQLVVAPILDVCSQACPPVLPTNPATDPTLPNGSNTWIAVIGFAKIFIDDVDGNAEVTGHLVDVAGCGASPGNCGGSSVLGYPLRLVRKN